MHDLGGRQARHKYDIRRTMELGREEQEGKEKAAGIDEERVTGQLPWRGDYRTKWVADFDRRVYAICTWWINGGFRVEYAQGRGKKST
jgi:hypothetical protein